MSNTDCWVKRAQRYRYSQDDRTLAWKFRQEIEPKINTFLDDPQQMAYVCGSFDLTREPWRMAVYLDFRKYGVKIQEKQLGALTEVILIKKKFRD